MPPKTRLADALRVLGLTAGASLDEAKVAYRRLALRWHPDKCVAPDAAERFLEIQDAFAAVTQSTGLDAEAEALLRDPLADLLGANWARGFADGTLDPNAAFESARGRALADLGGADPLAAAAAELGLDDDPEELRRMLELSSIGGGAGGLGDLAALGGDFAALGALPDVPGNGAANPFKEFFDSMPEDQRGPMMALFEKTFPAFLAQEMEEQQMQAENELFRHAVAKGALGGGSGASGRGAPSAAAREEAEALNADAVAAFGEGRYRAAVEALSGAIRLDPNNAAFYGNRSLAREHAGQCEEALEDAESALKCDPAYVAGYERKGRALLGLEAYAEAEAAFRRGLVLDADHAGCADGRDEAARAGAQHKLDILRTGSQVLDIDPTTLAAAPPPIRSLR